MFLPHPPATRCAHGFTSTVEVLICPPPRTLISTISSPVSFNCIAGGSGARISIDGASGRDDGVEKGIATRCEKRNALN